MILFFDTETSGLPDFNKRARDPEQPHIVQLAAIMTDDAGKVMESHNVIIKPDGWKIPKEVADIHGITEEIAAIGIPEKRAALLLFDMVKKSSLMVAHNVQFDKFLARIALRRHDIFTDAEDAWWKLLPTFCTMRQTTELCNLPGGRGNQPKWPKLTEAYRHIFGQEIDGAHDALADVTACMEIYFWLRNQPASESAGAK